MKRKTQSQLKKEGARRVARLFRKAGLRVRLGKKIQPDEIGLVIVKVTPLPDRAMLRAYDRFKATEARIAKKYSAKRKTE